MLLRYKNKVEDFVAAATYLPPFGRRFFLRFLAFVAVVGNCIAFVVVMQGCCLADHSTLPTPSLDDALRSRGGLLGPFSNRL